MTSPTSKKTVRLASLLNGSQSRKEENAQKIQPDVSADDFLDSIEETTIIDSDHHWITSGSSPLKMVSEDNSVNYQNTKSSDCEIVQEVQVPKVSLKQLLTGNVNSSKAKKSASDVASEEIEVVHANDPEKNRETHDRIMSALGSAKKTSVKDLFNNFQKRPRYVEERGPGSDNEVGELVKRMHEVSTLEVLETPLPHIQSITDSEDKVLHRHLGLKRKTTRSTPRLNFPPDQYRSLTQLTQEPQSKTVILQQNNKTVNDTIWTNEFEPEKPENVILEDGLKRQVESWFAKAFEKLRRRTTREKLLKKKVDSGEMDWFVVDDEIDDTKDQLEEFVPLMILFGEAVGKNTLVKTIMNGLCGQIFEINSSGNRSKKDFIDSVLDFSTTHYVKDKGSKGIILFDDADVLFRERDKLFWITVERLLVTSRRPVVLICRDINFIPFNIIQVAEEENSLFHAQCIDIPKAVSQLENFLESKKVNFVPGMVSKLLKDNDNDVRKCLLALQWRSVNNNEPSGNRPTVSRKFQTEANLQTMAFGTGLLSAADIVHNSIRWKSSIRQDKDHTFNYVFHSKEFTALSDEQRLAFDYMVDYKQHLHDCLKTPRLQFETSVAHYLMSTICDAHSQVDNDVKPYVEKATQETANYLSSRVPDKISLNSDQYASARMTRNSRKVKEILDRFSKNNVEDLSPFDEVFMCLTSVMTRHQITQEVIPFVCEVAKHDRLLKKRNKQIFENAMNDADPGSGSDVVKTLLQNHAFHPIWFNGEPDFLLNAWGCHMDISQSNE
ncbi:LANO_0D02476g1_1 [Lachancea nothofagi CBS 11611]|uniref:LANO_0D02476g1_1 n=1 Tax=Lachancea nothofagi CBS 11611 TaxID=1266666 RepID=A0A1G4JEE1_9SACH|nr:LANO_0D02476g1_1 [Lachancea nothofagi CBS 11611]